MSYTEDSYKYRMVIYILKVETLLSDYTSAVFNVRPGYDYDDTTIPIEYDV